MNPLSSDPCRKQPLASKQPSPRQGRPQLCGPCETTWLSMEGHGGTMPGHQGHAMPGHEGHAMPDHGSHTGSDCAMTMSWNTYTRDMCIVSPAWHIRSSHAFVFSLLLIFGISVSYEYLKWVVRCIDIAIVRLESAQSPLGRMRDGNNASTNATASLLRTRPTNTRRIIPMTYSDLVASDAAEERGENEDSLSTKHTAKATPRALRILYVVCSPDHARCRHPLGCTQYARFCMVYRYPLLAF